MPTITVEPATPDRFDDAQRALTGGGDGRVCQCQWWTITNAEYQRSEPREREQMLRREIDDGPPPALVAYVDGQAAGWVRVGPRAPLRRLVRTREIIGATREPLGDATVWSVSCFVVRKQYRGMALMSALLDAALAHARAAGARIVEAYPIDPANASRSGADQLYRGVLSVFLDAGFSEVARPKPDRALVILEL